MDNLDKPQFGILIGALLETSGQESTEARLLGYWVGLRDLTLQQVEAAVEHAIKTNTRHTASPGELRELATGGSRESLAIAAWCDVLFAVSVSYMADLDFADRIINAVIRSLGGRTTFFDRLAGGTDSEKWLRIEFLKNYQMFASRDEIGQEQIAVLAGSADRDPVLGRTYTPRLEVIAADKLRTSIAPPRINATSPWMPFNHICRSG